LIRGEKGGSGEAKEQSMLIRFTHSIDSIGIVKMKPQELFKPRHLLMPVETAAELLEISVEMLVQQIESGQNAQLVLIELPEGKYVEYKECV
jgi:hypothetical protein